MSGVREISRRWRRSLLRELAADAGFADPEALAAQLMLLYDGAVFAAQIERAAEAAAAARAAAGKLMAARRR